MSVGDIKSFTDSDIAYTRIDIPLQGDRAGQTAMLCESCDSGCAMTWEVFQERQPKLSVDFTEEIGDENPHDFVFVPITWMTTDYKLFTWRASYVPDSEYDPFYWCESGNDDEGLIGRWVS